MSLRLVLVLVLVLIVLVAVGVLGVLWWRKRRRAPAGDTGTVAELRRHVSAVAGRRPKRAREAPLTVVVGESGAGKSRLIRDKLAHRDGFDVIASEAGVTSYVSAERCVDEVSSALLEDASAGAQGALRNLWRGFDAGVAIVLCVLDHRLLGSTPAEVVAELAVRVRTLVRLLENAGQRRVEIRVALTNFDVLPGYAAFSGIVGDRSGTALPLLSLIDPLALGRAMRPLERRVVTALGVLEGAAFRDVVRLTDALAADVACLAPFVTALLRHEPSGRFGSLHLTGVGPTPWLSDPFANDAVLRAAARAGALHAAVRRAVRATFVLATALAVGFVLHVYWLRSAEARVMAFARQEEGARRAQSAEPEAPGASVPDGAFADSLVEASASEARLRYWLLPGVFVESRRHLRARYLDAVEQGFLVPSVLRAPTRAGFTYAAALDRAVTDNAYGALIAGVADVWSRRVGMPSGAVGDFMRVNTDRLGAPAITGALPHSRPAPATWGELLAAVGRALGAGQIAVAELERLKHAALFLTLPESSREYLALRAADALLASAGALNGVDDSDPPGFVGKNLVPLNRLRTLIQGSTIAPSGKPPATLRDLTASLKSQPVPPSASAARFEIHYGDQVYALSDAEWAALVLRSKTGPLIAEFVRRGGDGAWPFFDPAALPDDVPAAATDVRGYTRPLPGIYTRAAFENFVLPVLGEAQAGFADLPLNDQDRRTLVDFVRRSFAAYARAYGRELGAFYAGYFFRPATSAAVEREIAELTNPASWFTDFVSAVADNAAPPPKGVGAEPLANEVRPYASLLPLAKGALKDYGALFAEALPPAKDPAPADAQPSLASELSPVGRAALPPAKPGTPTLEAALVAWLDKASVSGARREPFLAPARLLATLGRAEIDRAVEQLWQKRVYEPARPLLRRFPFDPSGNAEPASVADIEAEFAPEGRFWQSFRTYVASVCQSDGERYAMRSGYTEPQGMLHFVNAAAAFSAQLWDPEGKRRVWLLDVTPIELPPVRAGETFVAQARLSVGGDSFYSFNQARSTKRLEFRFWTEGTSRLSIELRSGESDDEGARSSIERKGAFSLLRLLQVAERDSDTYRWKFPPGAAAEGIEFQIEPDPRRVFSTLRSAQP